MNLTDELSEQQERDDIDAQMLHRGRRMTGEYMLDLNDLESERVKRTDDQAEAYKEVTHGS